MADYLDDQVIERIPANGLFQSFNATVKLGGYEIVKSDNATVRVTTNTGKYYEIGSRYGTPYRKETRVSFSLSRAFVNLYEIILAMGLEPSASFNPGEYYSENEGTNKLSTLLKKLKDDFSGTPLTTLNSDKPANSYPIKTDAEFIINKDQIVSGNVADIESIINSDPANAFIDKYEMTLHVYGAILNTGQIQIGAAGDLIRTGPIDALAERAEWVITKMT